MTLISLDSVSKALGDGPLFEGASFGIEEGERIGFVGPNGSGKSTLLKILAGRLEIDDGALARKRGLLVNVLDQNPIWESGDSIRDFLFRSDDQLVQLVGNYEKCLQNLQKDDHKDVAASRALQDTLAGLSHDMDTRGGFDLERRFESLLSELGIQDLSLPMDTLSGGMAKKAALTRCLAPDSDLILLDEPTNHLDLDTIEWLEKKLVASGKAFVLVTHDRWFLDSVCTTIMEIDNQRVSKYEGGYSDYLARVASRDEFSQSRERRREAILRVELEWLKRGPKARGGKDKKRKERIRDMVDGRPEAEQAGSDAFQTASRRLGGKVLELNGVAKSWDGKRVLSPFSYKLTKGERIGVVGPNGSGKSTLLDLIANRFEADEGSIDRGETLAIGYFDQHSEDMDASLTIIEYVRKAAERVRLGDGTELGAEQFLERFGFPRTMHDQKLDKLSGGESRRLLLVRLLIASPNLILLDEPTNDFDISTIALLEDFLRNFGGCVIAVSHDRAFLEGMADSLWVLDGRGGIVSYVGSYVDWREECAELEAKKPKIASGASTSAQATAKTKSDKLSFKENKEFEGLLPEIEALETEKAELEKAFADPEASLAKDPAAYARAGSRYAELDGLIASKTLRWEALAERADS
ncbi:ABC-F family ATP-binding cassette domain-containing protein [Treponema sp.]